MAVSTGTAILSAAGLVAGGQIAGVLEQRKQSKRATSLQEEANRIEQSAASVEAARRRRLAVAQARVARAQNLSAGVEQGAQSSLIQGAQASIAAQTAENLALQQRTFASGLQTFNLRQSSQNALAKGRERAQLYALPGQLLSTAASAASFGQSLR